MMQRLPIYRMTHIDNVPFILRNGLWSKLSAVHDPTFKAIGNRRQAESHLSSLRDGRGAKEEGESQCRHHRAQDQQAGGGDTPGRRAGRDRYEQRFILPAV